MKVYDLKCRTKVFSLLNLYMLVYVCVRVCLCACVCVSVQNSFPVKTESVIVNISLTTSVAEDGKLHT